MIKNNKTKNRKIVVGMSGGVDSSMSLALLKKQGWQPIGVSLKYAIWQDKENLLRENVCCSTESFEIARSVCKKMNVPYHIFDVSKEFKKEVIDYFVLELENNRTPNPCIICNRYLKFKKLFEWAHRHEIKYVATGHYAHIRENRKNNKYELLKAKDKHKDQTYSLSFLPQKWLKNVVFPLGNCNKEEVFKMAKEQGFNFYLKRKQSQDFCFVAGKCLNRFLEKEIGTKPGLIKDIQGDVLGKHQGLHFYTIGQRKGIDLPAGPYFVVDKIFKNNILVISKNKRDLLVKEAALSPFNFTSSTKIEETIQVMTKIRSQQQPVKATLIAINSKQLKIVFAQPQAPVTPGQFAIFYQGDICFGGGRIIKKN